MHTKPGEVTARVIVDSLARAFEQRQAVPKERLLDAAMKLSVLSLEEVAVLTQMEQEIAKLKVLMLENQLKDGVKKNVSEVEINIEATDAYREMRRQKAFVGMIEEMIHTARLSAKLNEFAH